MQADTMATVLRIFMGIRHAFTVTTLSLALALPVTALTAGFSDVPASSALFPATEYLKSAGIIQTVDKFNPDGKLTRAQAAKVLVAPLVSIEELSKITASQFSDIPAGQWFTSYVEAARIMGLVDSAAKFNPNAPVTKSAFMKMLLKSKKMDYASAFSDFTDPLSVDVPNATDWFYPVMRFSLASSMTAVSQDGRLNPSQEITCGQMAFYYYRLDMYTAGRRTQALLSQAETDIGNVLQMLDQKDMQQAKWASARAVITARGALASKPNEAIVKGAMKISEGFNSLVLAYKAGVEGNLDAAINYAKEAYASAEKAKAFSPGLTAIATQMQTIGKNMADEARAMKAQPAAQ